MLALTFVMAVFLRIKTKDTHSMCKISLAESYKKFRHRQKETKERDTSFLSSYSYLTKPIGKNYVLF